MGVSKGSSTEGSNIIAAVGWLQVLSSAWLGGAKLLT